MSVGGVPLYHHVEIYCGKIFTFLGWIAMIFLVLYFTKKHEDFGSEIIFIFLLNPVFLYLVVSSPPARWGLLDFMSVACSSPPLLSSSSCSTATLDAQRSLSDLNHDHPRPVFPAGPQPRPSPPSVPCRTSTTTIHAQCSLPDLNREYPRQVFPAGPHVGRYGTKNVQKKVRKNVRQVCYILLANSRVCGRVTGAMPLLTLQVAKFEAISLNRWQSHWGGQRHFHFCTFGAVCKDAWDRQHLTASYYKLLEVISCWIDAWDSQHLMLDPASYFHPGELMGHIPILLIAGDFLQIKPANEISLADNLEELIRKMPHRVQTEHHAAQAALITIDTVIHLKKSKRFLDAHLPEITTAMRTCTPAAPLSEDHLAQLRTRKIENCKKELTTDLFKHGHVIGMYWENIARSMVERANRDAQDLDVPLFCLQAADQRHSRKNKAIDKQLTHQLLTVPNPHRTGKLQGMLLVHENMVVRLADVLAPHLGLVKDKLAVVVKVDLHHEDQKRLDRREPGFCHFFPDYMAKGIWVKLLKGKNSPMEDALLQTWEEKFQNVADHTTDAKTLFFVELVHAEFKIDLKLGEETEKIEVIRWQFPLLHGMLRTAYSAQGLTLDGGVLVDLRRGGGLEDADWWLAIYVMLTRAQTEESHLAGVHGASGGAFTQRPSYLLARTDWQVGNQSCFDAGAAAVLACLWCIASILTQCSASGT